MLRYVDTIIGFSEVPDEISLCVNFSGCEIRCEGCHSSYLWEDIGEELTLDGLDALIGRNEGITCVCFMGGDPMWIGAYARHVRKNHPIKIAWYTGLDMIPREIDLSDFDYVKLGRYDKESGGLDNPKTNQRMYEIKDITYKFQKKRK